MTNKDLNKEFMGIVKTRIWRAWSNEERFCEQTNITKETFNRLLEGEIELTDFVTTTRLDQIFGGTPGYFKEVLVGLTAKYKERLESISVIPEGFILVPVDLAKSIVSQAEYWGERNEFIDQLDKLIEERTR